MPNLRLHLYGTITGAMVMMEGIVVPQFVIGTDLESGPLVMRNVCFCENGGFLHM